MIICRGCESRAGAVKNVPAPFSVLTSSATRGLNRGKRMNRLIAVFAVALAVFLAPCIWQASPSSARGQEKSDKAELTKIELQDLQGTWKVIVFEQNGKELALQKR